MKPLVIAIQAIPGTSKNEILGWVPDAKGGLALKLRIQAQPEDGKANKALMMFLAAQWGIPKSGLELISGATSRHKRLKISDPAHCRAVSAALPPQPDI
ncbi:MAG: DUF167 domain-containing protein [Rickettsiales bacterium]|nr:DUF167 domain-containing protein [Rickettsiales bacterium]